MRDEKGFTLIELLAIIVILAVIAVITVPIVLGIIDDAKKGAAKDSAHGYIKAISNYYYTMKLNDSSFSMEGLKYRINNEGYLVSNDETIVYPISFSGSFPSQGIIDIDLEGKVNGCFVVDDFRFYIVDGDLSDDIVKGDDCKESFTITFNTNGGNEIGSITAKEGSTIEMPTPVKVKDDFTYTFIGWYTDSGDEATNVVPGYNVIYYAHYQDLGAKFDTNIVSKIKKLSNNNLANIHGVLEADSIDSEHKIDANKVSYTGTEPIYMWFENNNIYWYSLDDSPGFKGTSLSEMFKSASNLTDISGLSGWDMSGVTNMYGMFFSAISLSDISPLANWNTGSVTNMYGMFFSAISLSDISPLANWNTGSVTNMSWMFRNDASLSDISPLANWNTGSVTKMSEMFCNDTSLSDISSLANWNTGSVTNMSGMFNGATSLSDISPLANLNTGSVTNMSGMFCNDISLSDISPLANWNTGSVTNMFSMFQNDTSLSDISPLANWNTGSVTNMSCMFYGATSLSDISPLTNWNIGSVINMSSMFNGATSLSDISPLANWNTSSVTDMSSMFSSATSLSDASMLNWVIKNANNYNYMFNNANVRISRKYPTFYSDDEKTQVINGTWNSSGTFTPSS